jgi:hypothetical protein
MENRRIVMNSVKMKCMAKTSTGKACRFYAKEGESFCGRSNHNARTLKVGFNNPNSGFSTRGWSKYLPTELAEKAAAILNHPDYQNLMQEIEYVNVRLGELAVKISEIREEAGGNVQQAWIDLIYLSAEMRRLDPEQDRELFGEKFKEMGRLIKIGAEEYSIRREIDKMIDLKAKLLIKRQELMVREKKYIPLDQAQLFSVNLYKAIEVVLPIENKIIDSHDANKAIKRILRQKFNMKSVS